jgi:cell wall-associated NlpC family hydrolase
MPRTWTQTIRVALVALAGAAVASCATSSGFARPSPFPTAPLPPASVPARPASIQPARPADATAPDLPGVLQTALGLEGMPYRVGGDDPAAGFDCSGLIYYVYAAHHISLPRTVAEQFQLGKKTDLANLRAGDLVFFSTTAPGATHVGLMLDNDEFVHAPGENKSVRSEHVSSSYWTSRFVGGRRLFQ